MEKNKHLPFYNVGMSNIRIVTSVIGRAQRGIGRASALPGLYKTTPVDNTPALADDGCSDPFGKIAIHKIFLGNLLCGAIRTEIGRHVIGTNRLTI